MARVHTSAGEPTGAGDAGAAAGLGGELPEINSPELNELLTESTLTEVGLRFTISSYHLADFLNSPARNDSIIGTLIFGASTVY